MSEENIELVDFPVLARKYKTRLTNKFINRKVWIEPDACEIKSYIPGTIVKIFAKEGQELKKGEIVLMLEAMKMQNRIEMPFDGKIKKINVKEGVKIPKNTIMVEIEK